MKTNSLSVAATSPSACTAAPSVTPLLVGETSSISTLLVTSAPVLANSYVQVTTGDGLNLLNTSPQDAADTYRVAATTTVVKMNAKLFDTAGFVTIINSVNRVASTDSEQSATDHHQLCHLRQQQSDRSDHCSSANRLRCEHHQEPRHFFHPSRFRHSIEYEAGLHYQREL